MKKLLLLLFLIPNLVMADSYLCISDAAGGAEYDAKTKQYKSTVFKTGLKYILKKEGDNWDFDEFGTEPKIISSLIDCKEDKNSLMCNTFFGQFGFTYDELRYFQTYTFGFYPTTDTLGSTDSPYIELGSCSKI